MNHKPGSVMKIPSPCPRAWTGDLPVPPSVWGRRCRRPPGSLPVLEKRAAPPVTPPGRRPGGCPPVPGRRLRPVHCLTLLLMRFAIPRRCRRGGGLLPRLFTLTPSAGPLKRPPPPCWEGLFGRLSGPAIPGGILSVALSVNPPVEADPPGITRHHALRSPDFPPDPGPCPGIPGKQEPVLRRRPDSSLQFFGLRPTKLWFL